MPGVVSVHANLNQDTADERCFDSLGPAVGGYSQIPDAPACSRPTARVKLLAQLVLQHFLNEQRCWLDDRSLINRLLDDDLDADIEDDLSSDISSFKVETAPDSAYGAAASALQDAISKLGYKEREVIELLYDPDLALSVADTAKVLNLAPAAIIKVTLLLSSVHRKAACLSDDAESSNLSRTDLIEFGSSMATSENMSREATQFKEQPQLSGGTRAKPPVPKKFEPLMSTMRSSADALKDPAAKLSSHIPELESVAFACGQKSKEQSALERLPSITEATHAKTQKLWRDLEIIRKCFILPPGANQADLSDFDKPAMSTAHPEWFDLMREVRAAVNQLKLPDNADSDMKKEAYKARDGVRMELDMIEHKLCRIGSNFLFSDQSNCRALFTLKEMLKQFLTTECA